VLGVARPARHPGRAARELAPEAPPPSWLPS